MRYLAVLLLSSTLLACTTTQGTTTRQSHARVTTVDDLSEQDKLAYQMGVQYIERAEYQVAQEKLSPLTNKYSNFTDLYVTLGVLQERQGKTSDATALYSKAIAIDPMNRVAIKHYSKLQCDPYDKNAPQKMASIADSALPELKAGMNSGASGCYFIHRDYEKANEYADRAINANPNYADSFYFKALALNAMNRQSEVFANLDRYHDSYGYEPDSVYLGLAAAKKIRNKGEIDKYENVIARHSQ